ncbi:pantoate--beta-alanine ligase [Homoserinibacter sp. YIM 151385]|uniref:pantoate--beta-alanine ligase n=1 Tax=Homoserinibacter sp. YIM 151385 TaxID=2985506 RepID=UPI0022F0994B|nr:pantoate--beta-alanine ligase [Homoserinibacter sp. YIM 151385]WBU37560.1 pantoate--beta-alanine ligase [Homoserinibacter sp. YIM 151385]
MSDGTPASAPPVITTIAALRERFPARAVALVPTMGALHEGHLALVRRAAELADEVVVSIFVNPLQFGPSEDLDRYPRDLEADLALLAPLGVAAVFAPAVDEMYPDGPPQTTLRAGELGGRLEGRTRPGHFDGMLTVVAKLIHIARPAHLLFGQKDAQQVFLVERMVRDLDLEAHVEVVETVRAADGLALSSRNRYLDESERRAALALSRALEAADSAADRGIDAVIAAAQSVLMGEEHVEVDYFEVVDPATFLPVGDDFRGTARVLIAARVGPARLIDNDAIYLN